MNQYYLDNLDSIVETADASTMENCLSELIRRRNELTPLFNELIEKGVNWNELDPDTSNEWHAVVLGISKLKEKLK